MSEDQHERAYCGATTRNVEGERTVGVHLCDREPGHKGPHRCDICPHVWMAFHFPLTGTTTHKED